MALRKLLGYPNCPKIYLLRVNVREHSRLSSISLKSHFHFWIVAISHDILWAILNNDRPVIEMTIAKMTQYKDNVVPVFPLWKYNGLTMFSSLQSILISKNRRTYIAGVPIPVYEQNTCRFKTTQITKFMGPTWGPPGSRRPQMGPMLAL